MRGKIISSVRGQHDKRANVFWPRYIWLFTLNYLYKLMSDMAFVAARGRIICPVSATRFWTAWKKMSNLRACAKLYDSTWKCQLLNCVRLCDPMDCSLPGSLVHGILQARILERVAIPFFKGSSWPRDQMWVSCIAGRFFTVWATREVQDSAWGPANHRRLICSLQYCSVFKVGLAFLWNLFTDFLL